MTEFTPSSVTKSISNTLLRILPLMDTSTSRDNVGDRSTTTQDEQCQSDNDGDSISTGSTCSSCVSSCPSFVNQRDPLGHYRLVETLGIGEFGKIKLGIHTETDQKVAIKIIKKRSDPTILAKIEREIEILKSLRHPHIVKLIEVVETDTKIGIILEYASGGELFEYVLSHNSLDEDTARNLFAQLISSVKYMHVKGIVHRDLKLENMLFLDDEQTQLIVSDFGFANGDKKDLLKTSCGSPTYAAPELVFPSSNGYKGQAADIWSLGVILYCMVCGYLPFDDDPENPESANLHRLYQHIKSSTLSFPDSISPEAQDLIQHMLQPDPRKRCNIGFVIRHPWLKAHESTVLAMTIDELEQQALESIKHHLVPNGNLFKSHPQSLTNDRHNGQEQLARHRHSHERRHTINHGHSHDHDQRQRQHQHRRHTLNVNANSHDSNRQRTTNNMHNHNNEQSQHKITDDTQQQQSYRFLELNHAEDQDVEATINQAPVSNKTLVGEQVQGNDHVITPNKDGQQPQEPSENHHQPSGATDSVNSTQVQAPTQGVENGHEEPNESAQETAQDDVENLAVAEAAQQVEQAIQSPPQGEKSLTRLENGSSAMISTNDSDDLDKANGHDVSGIQIVSLDSSVKDGSVKPDMDGKLVEMASHNNMDGNVVESIQSELAETKSHGSTENLVKSDLVNGSPIHATGKSHGQNQQETSIHEQAPSPLQHQDLAQMETSIHEQLPSSSPLQNQDLAQKETPIHEQSPSPLQHQDLAQRETSIHEQSPSSSPPQNQDLAQKETSIHEQSSSPLQHQDLASKDELAQHEDARGQVQASTTKTQHYTLIDGFLQKIHQLTATESHQHDDPRLENQTLENGQAEEYSREMVDEGNRQEISNGTQGHDENGITEQQQHESDQQRNGQITMPMIGVDQLQHPMDIHPSTPLPSPDTEKALSPNKKETISHSPITLAEDNKQVPSFEPPLPPAVVEEALPLEDNTTKKRQRSVHRQKKFCLPLTTEDDVLTTAETRLTERSSGVDGDGKERHMGVLRPSLLGKNDSTRYYSAVLQGDLSNRVKDESRTHDFYQDENSGNKVQNMKSTSLPLLNQPSTMGPTITTATSTTDLNDAIKKYNNGASLPITKKHHKRFSSILTMNQQAPKPQRSQSTHLPKKTLLDDHDKKKESPPMPRKKTMKQTVKSWIHRPFKKHHHSGSSSLSASSSSAASSDETNHHHHHQRHTDPSSPSSLETDIMDQSNMRTLSHAQGEHLTPMTPGKLIMNLVRVLTALGMEVHHQSTYQLVCHRKSAHHAKKNKKHNKTINMDSAPIYGPPELDQGHHVDFSVEICRSLLPDLYVIDIQAVQGDESAFQFIKSKVLGFLHLNDQ